MQSQQGNQTDIHTLNPRCFACSDISDIVYQDLSFANSEPPQKHTKMVPIHTQTDRQTDKEPPESWLRHLKEIHALC